MSNGDSQEAFRFISNERTDIMDKFIVTYWAASISSVAIFTLLIYIFGWWIIPIFAVSSITISCLGFKALCGMNRDDKINYNQLH